MERKERGGWLEGVGGAGGGKERGTQHSPQLGRDPRPSEGGLSLPQKIGETMLLEEATLTSSVSLVRLTRSNCSIARVAFTSSFWNVGITVTSLYPSLSLDISLLYIPTVYFPITISSTHSQPSMVQFMRIGSARNTLWCVRTRIHKSMRQKQFALLLIQACEGATIYGLHHTQLHSFRRRRNNNVK